MATVITIAQQKGGTGKTTLAATIAASLAAARRAALLDIDPQRCLARWHALRAGRAARVAPVTCADVAAWRLAGELDRLRREHDVVLVDGPPQIDTDARLAIRAADLLIVPIQPSPPDLRAAEGTLAPAAAERRPARVVLNRVFAASRLRETAEADLRARGLPAVRRDDRQPYRLRRRLRRGPGGHRHSAALGRAAELRALVREFEELTA